MTDEPDVRPTTPAEAADVRAMHTANGAAWDEAAERYEGWLAEAIELIRAGGSNLFQEEEALLGDLRGRCHRAIQFHGVQEESGIQLCQPLSQRRRRCRGISAL